MFIQWKQNKMSVFGASKIKLIALTIYFMFSMGMSVAIANDPRVLFVNPGRTGEVFWDVVTNFMKAAARDLDINLKVVVAERDHLLMGQLARTAALSKRPPDYIILVNEKLAAGKLLSDLPKTINIILLNNPLSTEQQVKYGRPQELHSNWLATIIPDHVRAGEDIMKSLVSIALQSNYSIEQGPLGVIAIGGNRVTLASSLRVEGMLKTISQQPLTKHYQTIYSEWRRKKAEAQMYGLLRRWPETRLVWAANDPMALGAMNAAQRRGLSPGTNIFIGGLNWSNEALKNIQSGTLAVSVGGHFMLGGWAMVLIHDRNRGMDFTDIGVEYTIPMGIITKKNVTDYLRIFGDQKWEKVNFKRFLRTNKIVNKPYNFSLDKILSQFSK